MILVDGNNLAYRYKRPPFVVFNKKTKHMEPVYKSAAGFPTGSIFGVLQSLIGLVKHCKDPHVVVAWDSKHNLRKSEKGYKANRNHAHDGFIVEQMIVLHEVLPFYGFSSVKEFGYEADDIAFNFSKKYTDVTFISNDIDWMQFIDRRKRNCVYKQKEFYNTNPFNYDYRIYHSVVGSRKDNVIGIPYFKKKIAEKLAMKYTSIKTLIENESGNYPKFKQLERVLYNNYDLLTLKRIPGIFKKVRKAAYSSILTAKINRYYTIDSKLDDQIHDLWSNHAK